MKRRDQILIGLAAIAVVVVAYVNFQDRRLDLGGETHQAALTPTTAGPSAVPEAAAPVQPETFGWEGYADAAAGFEIKYPVADAAKASDPEAAAVSLPPAPGEKPRTLHIEVLSASDPRLDKSGCVDAGGPNGQLIGEPSQGALDGLSYCLTTRDVSLVDGRLRSYLYAIKLRSGRQAVVTFTIKFQTTFMVRSVSGCEQDADQATPRCRILNFDEKRDTDLFVRILKTFSPTK